MKNPVALIDAKDNHTTFVSRGDIAVLTKWDWGPDSVFAKVLYVSGGEWHWVDVSNPDQIAAYLSNDDADMISHFQYGENNLRITMRRSLADSTVVFPSGFVGRPHMYMNFGGAEQIALTGNDKFDPVELSLNVLGNGAVDRAVALFGEPGDPMLVVRPKAILALTTAADGQSVVTYRNKKETLTRVISNTASLRARMDTDPDMVRLGDATDAPMVRLSAVDHIDIANGQATVWSSGTVMAVVREMLAQRLTSEPVSLSLL